jgi:predicted N-formylglutamate amidohydrolase
LPLLADDEPRPFQLVNASGRAPLVLVCEHAGRMVPRALGTLGLPPEAFERHIAYDLGAAALARELARRLDAPLALQPWSRLVCDCNRRPDVPSFAPEVSEDTAIPGNRRLDPAARQARLEAIFEPFHRGVRRLVDAQLGRHGRIAFVTIHSFTPVFLGVRRELEVGLLFNRDRRLADAVGRRLRQWNDIRVVDNEPYRMDDDSDYTVPVHAERRGLPYLELEIRNDLLATAEDRRRWADRLAEALRPALADVLDDRATAGPRAVPAFADPPGAGCAPPRRRGPASPTDG